VPANKRSVNTVFQSYALFPFLTVFDNVAFGLRNRGADRATIRRRVDEALELVHMKSFEKRRSLKVELKALQERVGITFLYVTHDQEEALTISDRLAVMRAGKIVQMGVPKEIYNEPADTYVADFFGVSNLMEVDVIERGPGAACKIRLGESVLAADYGGEGTPDRAHAVIRPERVRIEPFGSASGQDEPAGPNRVPAMVERLVYLGSATQVLLRLAAGMQVQALVQNDGDHQVHLSHGTPVRVHLAPDALRVLTGDAISPTGDDPDTERAAQHSKAG
jgi:spermidine/putrescine transport system ATP-binding protein